MITNLAITVIVVVNSQFLLPLMDAKLDVGITNSGNWYESKVIFLAKNKLSDGVMARVDRTLELPSFDIRRSYYNKWVFECKFGQIRGRELLISSGHLRVIKELEHLCEVDTKMDRADRNSFSEPVIVNIENMLTEIEKGNSSEEIEDTIRLILVAHYLAFGWNTKASRIMVEMHNESAEKKILDVVLDYVSGAESKVRKVCSSKNDSEASDGLIMYICAWWEYKQGRDDKAKEFFRSASDAPFEIRKAAESDIRRLFGPSK